MSREPIERAYGTTAEHAAFTGINREITIDDDKNTAVVHDGVTPGGFPLARADQVDIDLMQYDEVSS